MRLPLVLGVLAAVSTPVWFWPHRGESAAAVAASAIFGKQAPSDQVTELRVVTWDDGATAAQAMEVKKANGQWTIPSHFDFPADGNTRVSKAAEGFLGIERGRKITSDDKRFEDLGVIDPLDSASISKKGHGKRVTMKDATGAQLVDLIVGKYVEGASGLYYLREADSKDVYTAKVDPWELSTKFIDYVETDPFKIQKDAIRTVTISDYSVDEAAQTVVPRSETGFVRTNALSDWTTSAKTQAPADKRVAKTALDNLVNEVTALRLAGVRPYRREWLTQRGFYLSKEGLYGNEGAISVTTTDGLRYWMFFGEVALDDEADKNAEKPTPADAKAAATKPADAKPDAPKGNNRYLAIFVQYDEASDEVKIAEKAAEKSAEAAKKDGDKKDEPKKKKLSGAERAKAAQARFSQFFYVISDDSFKKLRPSIETLFEAKPAEPMAGTTGKTNVQWLEEHGKQPGVTTLPSGLQYEVITAGPATGTSPTDTNQAEVRYRGTLIDGQEFDSTKGDATTSFGVTGVIKGWTEALKLMRPGDKWKLTIPPALGYGDAGSPPKIPAHAILQFDIELVSVK